MKSTLLTLTALASLLSFSSAQDKTKKTPEGGATPYDPAAVVKRFDKNTDGKLSLEEYSAMGKWKKEADPAAAAKTSFTASDTNKDGSLTVEEIKAAHEARAKAALEKKAEGKKGDAKKDAAPATEVKPAVEVKPTAASGGAAPQK